MPTVTCRSIFGNSVEIQREKLSLRVGVYAILSRNDHVLLMTNHSSGKFAFPGGGVELGETLEQTLRREVREEVGIEIEILRFVNFRENFFYYDPKDEAFHGFQFYYSCKPIGEVPDSLQVADDESGMPRWVKWKDCSSDEFQSGDEYDMLSKFIGIGDESENQISKVFTA